MNIADLKPVLLSTESKGFLRATHAELSRKLSEMGVKALYWDVVSYAYDPTGEDIFLVLRVEGTRLFLFQYDEHYGFRFPRVSECGEFIEEVKDFVCQIEKALSLPLENSL